MCDSTIFPVQGQNYSRVCGRILAYQRGTPDALSSAVTRVQTTLDSTYADCVSLAHGPVGSRQHIWTFVAAHYEKVAIITVFVLTLIIPGLIEYLHSSRTSTSVIQEVLNKVM